MGEGPAVSQPIAMIDQALTRGIVEMVVAPNDMRHAHVVVVGHDRQVIGRRAIGTQQHQIVEILGVWKRTVALHQRH